jgi:hypothetical protein
MIGNIAAGLYGVGVAPVTSSYESIATVSVGSGGSSSIDFTSIPSTYKHLQIRALILPTASGQTLYSRVGNGSIDSGSNYSDHSLFGQGSSTGTSYGANVSFYRPYGQAVGSSTSAPTAMVVDYLEYANANTYKTFRSLAGNDLNGSGEIGLYSGSWRSTSAINTLNFYMSGANFAQYSHFALYGIKD